MVGNSGKIVCGGCGDRQKKFPTDWVMNNQISYCASCWSAVKCDECSHHDPKGAFFRGRWQCRACRHKESTKSRTGSSMQEECHRMIIEDESDVLPQDSSPSSWKKQQALSVHAAVLEETEEADDDDGEAGGGGGAESLDSLAPLRRPPQAGRPRPQGRGREEPSHIVLLLDASGSMRIEDVVSHEGGGRETKEPATLSRLEAAACCARDFVAAHARVHPGDVYSAATISDASAAVCEAASAQDAKDALEGLAVRGAGGTFYKPALAMAAKFLEQRPGVAAGHVVMLSDGRPADTKAALKLFQKLFVNGRHSSAHLHGIAFGATVESYAPLQQLACIGGGTFTLSSCSMRSLCESFTSVSSSITSIREGSSGSLASWADAAGASGAAPGPAGGRVPRQVIFELPEIGTFGKKGVARFKASRSIFRYDGSDFHKQEWEAGDVEMRAQPYMRGGMRLVHGFRDNRVVDSDAGWMVAKMSRFTGQAFNSLQVVEAHAKSTAVARHFAQLFNEQVQAAVAPRGTWAAAPVKLVFVPCFVYEAAGPSVGGGHQDDDAPGNFAAERYLPGIFLKYNSNNGYVNDGALRHHDAVQAFLHFSFVRSRGALLVADLQGVARDGEVLLTDPQVLSVGQGGTFGPGDLGARGAKACLAAHRCGPMCRHLGLKPVSGPLLRRLEAACPAASAAAMRPGRAGSSAGSAASWEHVGAGEGLGGEGAQAGGAEWDRLSEYNLTDIALSDDDGVRSSQASTSSWVHLLDM